jgi:hypothetical protein
MIPTAVLAAQYAGTFELVDTTYISARTSDPPLIVAVGDRLKKVVLAADVTTTAAGRLRLRGHRWVYTLSYAPTLTGTDVELGFEPEIFQTGATSIEWRDRFVRFVLSESGSYGTTFAFQQLTAPTQMALAGMAAGQAPPATQPSTTGQQAAAGQMPGPGGMPPVQMPAPMMTTGQTPSLQSSTLQYGASTTLGTVFVRTGDRTTVSLTGGYRVGGGLDTPSKAVIPEQYGPTGSASLIYTPTRRDTLTATASGSQFVTSGPCPPPLTGQCTENVPLAQLQGTLRHQVSAPVVVTLGAGAALTEISTPTLLETAIVPVGTAALSYHLPHRNDVLLLSAGLAPFVDLVSGTASYRIQGVATLSHALSRTAVLTATAGAIKSVPFPVVYSVAPEAGAVAADPYPLTAFDGGLEARFRLTATRILAVGTHEFYQYQTGYGTLASTTTFARMGLTRELEVGVGFEVFWPGGQSYATLLGPPSTSTFLTVTGRIHTLRF